MKKIVLSVILLLSCIAVSFASESVRVDMSIKVYDAGRSTGYLAEQCEKCGGYVVYYNASVMNLRIPADQVASFRDLVEKHSSKVLYSNISTSDTSSRLMELQNNLAEKKKLLDRYSGILRNADYASALEVEKAMLALVREIEALQGQINMLQEEGRMALFSVALETSAVVSGGDRGIVFDWIDDMTFDKFLNWRASETRPEFSKHIEIIPSGFALEARSGNFYTSVSPDGCRFIKKKVKNYPEKDAEFWKNILEKNFLGLGYSLEDFQEIDAAGGKVSCFKWSVSGYDMAYTYMTAFRVNGKILSVIAAGGEKDIFAEYIPEIMTLVSEL
ncbi:MAG: DUF4349 domain-containing protein [Spirochaetia bacterium]|nr:DUF4349 domain-containing protein [Spirochaetia bacterium]